MGNILKKLGNYNEAIDAFKKVNPDEALTWVSLCKKGRLDK